MLERFDAFLIEQGYAAKGGQILIPVPKPHNPDDENQQIQQGEVPAASQDKLHERRQKDTDARWTKKGSKSYFGYKDHICIDVEQGLIRRYSVTDASVHDSQVLSQLLDEDNDSDAIGADRADRCEALRQRWNRLGLIVRFRSGIIAIIPSLRRSRSQPASNQKRVPQSSMCLVGG